MSDRIYTLPCPHCPSIFRGRAPHREYERHTAEHRSQQVQAVVSS